MAELLGDVPADQVREAIEEFVRVHNENCQLFELAKRDVRPKHQKPKYANS